MYMRRSLNMTRPISCCYRLGITLVFFLCAAASLPASAGEPVKDGAERPSTTVKFGDLDLNTDAGSRELLKRLGKAADRVCWQQYVKVRSAIPYDSYACYQRTLTDAVEKVHHAHVSALFAATSR
jgi:UrcA family protein